MTQEEKIIFLNKKLKQEKELANKVVKNFSNKEFLEKMHKEYGHNAYTCFNCLKKKVHISDYNWDVCADCENNLDIEAFGTDERLSGEININERKMGLYSKINI